VDPVGQPGDGGGGGRAIGHAHHYAPDRCPPVGGRITNPLVQASEDRGDWHSASFPGTLRDVIIEFRKVKH
jgi:hypothetical protein